MNVLIDTNVLLDVLCDRAPFAAASAAVWKYCETRKINGIVSALSVPNIAYIMRKELTPERTEQILRLLLMIFDVSELKAEDLKKAASLHFCDFEDALQVVTAEKEKASYIITRNTKDFVGSQISAVTPADFLKLFRSSDQEV